MKDCAVSPAMLAEVDNRERAREAAIQRAEEAVRKLKPEETAARLDADLQAVQREVTELRQVP